MNLDDLIRMAGNVLETARPWLAPGFLLGIFGLLLRQQVQNRRIGVDEKRVRLDDDKDIRDHYADEVRQLRDQVVKQGERHRAVLREVDKDYKASLTAAESRHDECVQQRDELRDQVRALKDLVDGLQRVILQNSASGVIALGDAVHPDVRAAAERVEELFNREKGVEPK